MALLGVGTTADSTNPLSAKLNNALFAAKTVAEGGDGNLRYKLSKENAVKTLSFLFQSNYSGRAEMGLTGDDDFHFKVNADGTIWHDGIVIDRATGAVTFPNTSITGGRERLSTNRTYYVRIDGSDSNDGLSNASGGAFLTLQKAINVALTLDLGGYAVSIQVGAGTYTAGVLLTSSFVGGNVTLVGDTTTPGNVVISTPSDCIKVTNQATLEVKGFKLTSSANSGVFADTGGVINITGLMEYGACSVAHLRAASLASIMAATANYTISGGAGRHVLSATGALVRCAAVTVTLTGTPAFSTAFATARTSAIASVEGNTFSGSATGPRYSADALGLVFVNGASTTYLPGDAAGSTASGAQYA